MKARLSVLFLVVACSMVAWAQGPVNLKFGKPTKEELSMTTYTTDSSAAAVVLCRLTDVSYTLQETGFVVDYQEKVRIKVLKPEGARYADVVIPYYYNEKEEYEAESIEDLKATAYNLDGSKTVRTSMGKNLVFREQLDDKHFRLKFTIPQVRQGTVIEYEYVRHSNMFYILHDWFPQTDIPVAFARLTMEIPAYLMFNVEDHGIQRLACQVSQGSMSFKIDSDALAANQNVKTNKYVCVGSHLKAMPKDRFVWAVNDYRAGITAELRSYSMPGVGHARDFTKTWEQIDDLLLNDDDLGVRLGHHSPLRDELEADQIAGIADEQERMAAVCKKIMSRVSWNGNYKLWPEASSSSILKKGTGSNADINLLLIQSLRDVGLQAVPVVLRERDYGALPQTFPTIQKLTTYIVGVILKGGSMAYVDASSADGYLNVLPAPLQVGRARAVVKGNKSQWVNLQKVTKTNTKTIVNATLAEDGTLHGTQTTLFTGNAAAEHRRALREAGDSTAYKNSLAGKYGLQILSCRQEHGADFAPSATETLEFSRQGEVSNGHIYVSPFCMPPMSTNPFTATERLMPVEFPYLQSEQVVVNITLPKGYVMEDGPKQTSATTPDKGLSGRLLTTTGDGKVQVQYQFSINAIVHPNSNYPALRQMFEMFAEHSKDLLVVKRAE